MVELLSLTNVSSPVVWVGIDSTPLFAPQSVANKLYTVFEYKFCAKYLDGVTGLAPSDIQLIALAGFLSFIFLIREGHR